jgi:NADH-quinone oxidoreductase subunit N
VQPPVQIPDLAWSPILPELVLVATAIVVLLADAIRPARTGGPWAAASVIGLAVAAWASIRLWVPAAEDSPERALTVFAGMVGVDNYAVFFRVVVLVSAAIAVVLSAHAFRGTEEARGEHYALLLFATSGMTLLVAATDLIVVFLALEVLSLSLYVMAGSSLRRLASQEAGMKYFLLGAFSSAFFLYGVAMAYGATGTTSLGGIAEALSNPAGGITLALVAAALLAVGFAFKVAAVPFHMWTPDVYQGAPTPVTAFMAAGTKVAGFAALIRVAQVALGPVTWELQPALIALSAVTMAVGSVLAIAQQDVKRMLAYSSIAHAGFVLVGVAAANQEGVSGAMFYLVAYAAMIMGAFAVVVVVSRGSEERTSLRDFSALGRRSPGLAAVLALFLLSLAGLPPTAGFVAKVLVFQAAVDAGLAGLVIVAVLASVVAAFFYIRLIVVAYMVDPETDASPLPTAAGPGWSVAAAAAVTLVLGVFPSLILGIVRDAAILRW